MSDGNTTARRWADPDIVDEARIKVEAGTRVLAAALLDCEEWPLELAAEHAIVMGEQAARLLAIASAA